MKKNKTILKDPIMKVNDHYQNHLRDKKDKINTVDKKEIG